MTNRTLASCVLVGVTGWILACSGVAPSAPAVGSPAAPADVSVPTLGAVVGTDSFAGAGCTCTLPTGGEYVFLSNGGDHAMHIDGADHRLTLVSDEPKGAARVSRYNGEGYEVTLRWKVLEEREGGTAYDVKGKVTRTGGGTLETALSCGCSN